MKNTTPNMQDYAETYRDFKLDVPEHFNFAFDVVDKGAEDRTKLALISLDPSGENAQHHFLGLEGAVDRFANVLKGLGVGKGTRAFVMLPRIPQWYVVMLGLMKVEPCPCRRQPCEPPAISNTGSTRPKLSWQSRIWRTRTRWPRLPGTAQLWSICCW